MDLSVVPYGEMGRRVGEGGDGVDAKPSFPAKGGGGRYRECMRNHAAGIGGHAYDGCGEFMPGGEIGTLEALKCAACGCHRSFHRKEGGCPDAHRPFLLYSAVPVWERKKSPPELPFLHPPPPPHPPLGPMFPFPSGHPYHQSPLASPTGFNTGDRSRGSSETPPPPPPPHTQQAAHDRARKRHRTKFSQEQKEKMQAFAEKLGWKIQKHDDVALQEFCMEIGVKRHVLKVWMHNNKSTLSGAAADRNSAAAAAPPPIRV